MSATSSNSTPVTLRVAPDHFDVIGAGGTLAAVLDSSVAACFYDAVEESGGLVHLRVVTHGDAVTGGGDVTDESLAADLLLLERCLGRLRTITPNARHWQARLYAHGGALGELRNASTLLSDFVRHWCEDGRIQVVALERFDGAPLPISFSPSMGQVRLTR